MRRIWILLLAATVAMLAGCGSDSDVVATPADDAQGDASSDESTDGDVVEAEDEDVSDTSASTVDDAASSSDGVATSFRIDVWADNWMAVYVNGELVGEDSVSITTERSFNAESFTFEATYPFTIAIEAKDFKETDSGLEYIGTDRQQMGDGGIIAQVTDLGTGDVVSVTDSSWAALVVHRAPLNTECEDDADPDSTCQFEIVDTPAEWTTADFDASNWPTATEWSASAVSPKDGYDEIDWDSSAALIWGTDLEVDNTVLLRTTVAG